MFTIALAYIDSKSTNPKFEPVFLYVVTGFMDAFLIVGVCSIFE